jgi:hypothetical protein
MNGKGRPRQRPAMGRRVKLVAVEMQPTKYGAIVNAHQYRLQRRFEVMNARRFENAVMIVEKTNSRS